MIVTIRTTGTLGVSCDRPIDSIEIIAGPDETPVVVIHGPTEVLDAAGTEGARLRYIGGPVALGGLLRPLPRSSQ